MKDLPVRKDIRLKGYDYSSAGYYFITICVKDKRELLGKIAGIIAQPGNQYTMDTQPDTQPGLGDAHPGVPFVELTETGIMVKQHIESIQSVYNNAQIDKYVVMPNHIHIIIITQHGTSGCTSPTKAVLAKVISAFKSLTSRQYGLSLWQRSYHDHIIRDEPEYRSIWQYIDENPQRWSEDCYYTEQQQT